MADFRNAATDEKPPPLIRTNTPIFPILEVVTKINMDLNPAMQLKSVGDRFQEYGHDLAAAIVYCESAQAGNDDPDLWFDLAVSLRKMVGSLINKPFYEWSARSMKRVLLLNPGADLEEMAVDALMNLSRDYNVDDIPAIAMEDLPKLLSFLDIDINIFPNAISALPGEERGFAVMVLGDQGNVRFLPTMLSAVRGVWGDFHARAALKRLSRHGDSAEIRETLEIVAFSAKAPELQPYLRMAMVQVDQEWAFETISAAAEAREESGEAGGFPPGMAAGKPWWKFWNR